MDLSPDEKIADGAPRRARRPGEGAAEPGAGTGASPAGAGAEGQSHADPRRRPLARERSG
jgi:hypothetical protein